MKLWRWMMASCLVLSLCACSWLDLKLVPSSARLPTAWHFQAKPNVLLYTGGNDVTVQASTTGLIDITLQNNHQNPPTLVSSVDGQQLKLTMTTDMFDAQNSRVVVSLPANVKQLIIVGQQAISGAGKGVVQTTALPSGIRRLAVQDLRLASIQGQSINLTQLIVTRVTHIQLNGLNSPNLELKVSHSGPVKLSGVTGLSHLGLDETGPVAVSWVNSRQLNLDLAGKEHVFLAGTTDLLISHLSGQSTLDAKYLRAKTAFIQAEGTSRAEVTVLDSLNAYAQDKSNIYYYHLPKLVGRYYQSTGTVLYMGDTAPPCLQPQCPFMPHDLPG